MSVELGAAEAFFAAQLQADVQLTSYGITGYFGGTVPPNYPPPYVLWSFVSAQDITEMAGIRINVQAVYLVRIVNLIRDFSDMQAAADRIDAVLHRSSGAALGHAIPMCVREAPYELVEDRGDIQWRHLGGRFRIWVES